MVERMMKWSISYRWERLTGMYECSMGLTFYFLFPLFITFFIKHTFPFLSLFLSKICATCMHYCCPNSSYCSTTAHRSSTFSIRYTIITRARFKLKNSSLWLAGRHILLVSSKGHKTSLHSKNIQYPYNHSLI